MMIYKVKNILHGEIEKLGENPGTKRASSDRGTCPSAETGGSRSRAAAVGALGGKTKGNNARTGMSAHTPTSAFRTITNRYGSGCACF